MWSWLTGKPACGPSDSWLRHELSLHFYVKSSFVGHLFRLELRIFLSHRLTVDGWVVLNCYWWNRSLWLPHEDIWHSVCVCVLLHDKALGERFNFLWLSCTYSNALTRSSLPWCVHCWTKYHKKLNLTSNHTLQVQLSSQSLNQL